MGENYNPFKGIPSDFFQNFFEIAKRTFMIKEKNLCIYIP